MFFEKLKIKILKAPGLYIFYIVVLYYVLKYSFSAYEARFGLDARATKKISNSQFNEAITEYSNGIKNESDEKILCVLYRKRSEIKKKIKDYNGAVYDLKESFKLNHYVGEKLDIFEEIIDIQQYILHDYSGAINTCMDYIPQFNLSIDDIENETTINKMFRDSVFYRLAYMRNLIGQQSKMLEELNSRLSMFPYWIEGYNYRGQARYWSLDFEGALKDLERYINSNAYQYLSTNNKNDGDCYSFEYLKKIGFACKIRAHVYLRMGKYREAYDDFIRSSLIRPDDDQIIDSLKYSSKLLHLQSNNAIISPRPLRRMKLSEL